MSTKPDKPDVLLTGPGARIPIPPWMSPYSPRTVPGDEVRSLRELPELTVVETEEPSTVLEYAGFLSSLAARHSRTSGPSKILFVFKTKESKVDAKKLSDVLVFFSRFTDIEFARGAEQAAFALQEALAKLLVLKSQAARASSSDPLGNLASVIAATSGLRADSGRLSAQKVAAAFGLSVAEVAKLLGKSRQSVSKTADAESIQQGLAPFARIARLRAVLSEEDFRAWLHLPNELLDGQSPWGVIRSGGVGVVADLAEDMLSGSPA